MNRQALTVAWASILFGLTACERANEETSVGLAPQATGAVLTVYTVNYPLAWMAGRIGGDSVQVVLPVPEDVDPAHWQPSPEAVLDYQRADLVLLNGAGYAGWTRFASLSPGRRLDTTRGMEDRLVPAGEVTHSHGPGGEHDHAGVASHTWLDPRLAAGQGRAIANALAMRLPGREDELRQRLQSLEADLQRLDERLTAAFDGWRDAGVLYSHPVYQYLDARYSLDGWSVTWEPGENPGDAEWNALAGRVADRPAAVMLWEGEPSPGTADRLRRMGIEPVVFYTGAVAPSVGDYLTLMEENRARVVEVDVARGGGDH